MGKEYPFIYIAYPLGHCKHVSSAVLDEGPKINSYNWTLVIVYSDHFLKIGTLPYLAEMELFNTCAGFGNAKCF